MRPLQLLPPLLLGLLGGCAAPVRQEVVYDFVARFPLAEQRRSRLQRLDFGNLEHQGWLGWGWKNPSQDHCWASGDRSELLLGLAEPTDLELEFRCASHLPQSATCAVNGQPLQALQLSDQESTYRLKLDRRLLRAGINRLNFSYSKPANETVCWKWLVVHEPSAVACQRSGSQLNLPPAARLDYYIRIPPGSRFEVDRLVAPAGEAQLELLVQPRSGSPEQHRLRGQGPHRLQLQSSGLCRVELRSRLAQRLHHPRLMSPSPPKARTAQTSESRPHVVVYLVDTLRARNLGCYGYGRPTSPEMDRLAEQSWLFENAQAHSSFTKCSLASLFTGRLPRSHGCLDFSQRLDEPEQTLAETLQGAGYQCFAVVANGLLKPGAGFDQGFSGYSCHDWEPTARLLERSLEMIDRRDPQRPFLLYVHSMDPHAPYRPPEPLRRRFAPGVHPKIGFLPVLGHKGKQQLDRGKLRSSLMGLYDAQIAHNDQHLGRLIAELKARGIWDHCLLIVTADHGEEFAEHRGWGHSESLYSEVLDVPMLIRFPDGRLAGQRFRPHVQHIDLLPTLCHYLGLDPPAGCEGRNLLTPALEPTPIFASIDLQAPANSGKHWVRRRDSVVVDGVKLIETRTETAGWREPLLLYDLQADPWETRDLMGQEPVIEGYALTLLRERQARWGNRSAPEVSDQRELLRQLESLQYLR